MLIYIDICIYMYICMYKDVYLRMYICILYVYWADKGIGSNAKQLSSDPG
jgi:hypothetical protein